jgi:hypothetical protein
MQHKADISWEEARKRIYMVDSKGEHGWGVGAVGVVWCGLGGEGPSGWGRRCDTGDQGWRDACWSGLLLGWHHRCRCIQRCKPGMCERGARDRTHRTAPLTSTVLRYHLPRDCLFPPTPQA